MPKTSAILNRVLLMQDCLLLKLLRHLIGTAHHCRSVNDQ
jgi:hypothetical protein